MTSSTRNDHNVRRSAVILFLIATMSGCATYDRMTGYHPRHCPECGSRHQDYAATEHKPPNSVQPAPGNATEVASNSHGNSGGRTYPVQNKDSSDGQFSKNLPEKKMEVADNLPPSTDGDNDSDSTNATTSSMLTRIARLEEQLRQEQYDRQVVERHVGQLDKAVGRSEVEKENLKKDIIDIEEKSKLQHESEMATLRAIEQVVEQLGQKQSGRMSSMPPFSQ